MSTLELKAAVERREYFLQMVALLEELSENIETGNLAACRFINMDVKKLLTKVRKA
jgi:hypothetical protein